MSLTELLKPIQERVSKSTKVVGWYPHPGDGAGWQVRGPFCRWFQVTEVSPEYRKHVASTEDDAIYCATAMMELPRLIKCVEVLSEEIKFIESASRQLPCDCDFEVGYCCVACGINNGTQTSLNKAESILRGEG
jgi:hypothetical protein